MQSARVNHLREAKSIACGGRPGCCTCAGFLSPPRMRKRNKIRNLGVETQQKMKEQAARARGRLMCELICASLMQAAGVGDHRISRVDGAGDDMHCQSHRHIKPTNPCPSVTYSVFDQERNRPEASEPKNAVWFGGGN